MDIHAARDELQAILNITEAAEQPIRGPYDSKPRVSLVDVQSEGYRDLEPGVWMAATRPLMGADVNGKNPDCYYPVGFVHVERNANEQIAQNLPLDAQFIVALEPEELRALAVNCIDPKFTGALNAMPEDKRNKILSDTAKRELSQVLLEKAVNLIENRCEFLNEHGESERSSLRG